MSNCAKCGKEIPLSFYHYVDECGRQVCGTCSFTSIETVNDDIFKVPPPAKLKENDDIKGWICPVCGAGLSPYTSRCTCKDEVKMTWGYLNSDTNAPRTTTTLTYAYGNI